MMFVMHNLVVDMIHQVQNYYQFLYQDDVLEDIVENHFLVGDIDLVEDNVLVVDIPYFSFIN